MAEIGPDPGGTLPTMGPGHRPQVEVDIDPRGGAGSGPVPGTPASGRGLDHGGRHGELTHAQPQGRTGIHIRGLSEHQHSPCADVTPDLFTEWVVIAGSVAPGAMAHQSFSSRRSISVGGH